MIEIFVFIINKVFAIQLKPDQLSYEIFIDEKTKNTVSMYLTKYNLTPRDHFFAEKSFYIVFNLSANDSVRRISTEQAYSLGNHLGSMTSFRTVLLHSPNDHTMLEVKQNLVNNSNCLSFPERGSASLLEIASLIEGALAVVTPDTSIIHFASATTTPVVGFYTKMQDVHEWLPHRVKNHIIISAENEPTSSILILDMIDAINDFIKELNIEPLNK
jgi:ADP-heptose:LPS heptosyltransferase